jgi:hypothetical protein
MKKRLLYFLLALPVVLLLLLETGLRLTRGEGDFPPVEARLTNDIPGVARTVEWSVGTDGLRKSGWEDGRPRVLCLGGDNSMPVLQSNDNTWWGVAARQLQEQGAPVAMAAGGQSNQSSSSALRWIPHFASLAKPSVVVLSFGPGEVLYRPAGYRWEPGSLTAPIEVRPGGWKGKILGASALAREIRSRRQLARLERENSAFFQENALRDRFTKEAKAWRQAPQISEIPWIHNPSDEIAACIREFSALAKKHHFQPIVLWEPWPHRPELENSASPQLRHMTYIPNQFQSRLVATRPAPGWVDHRLRAFRTRAQVVAAGEAITFVDAAASLGDAPGMFIDDTLWTDAGAKAVGQLMAQPIRDALAKSKN